MVRWGYAQSAPVCNPSQRRGTSLVELALVLPLLALLLFGIIEMGLLFKDISILSSAAREGARSLAVRRPFSEVTSRILETASTLDPALITITYAKGATSGSGWSWTPVTSDTGLQTRTLMKVTVRYPHKLVMGTMFSMFATPGYDGKTIILQPSVVMTRE